MKLMGPDSTLREVPSPNREFLMLADHPALDFLNTEVRINGEVVDFLESDDDVLRWLARAGWPTGKIAEQYEREELLELARALRMSIRVSIERRKAGSSDCDSMNIFLHAAHSHLKLISESDGSLRLERRWNPQTLLEVLGPLSESAAELLVNGDLEMIKRCEDADCVLWFYDRTRAHRRRWCSMATCGTRNKVAAFRDRA
jgi:predicted RNA-binding Zn ribbon-like protein